MLASEIQAQKNRRRLVLLFALLVVTVAAFFLLGSSGRSVVDKNIFRNVDFESVDRVRIQNRSDTTELTFANGSWAVSEKLTADRKMITLLFATLKQTEPKREISAERADSVAKYFQSNASNVTLYSGHQPVQNFLVAGNPEKTQTFFKDPKSAKIYLMSIPGYRVYIGGIFEMEASAWRDKFVLGSFNWRNFASLETKFSEKPTESFKVAVEGPGLLAVEGIKTDTAKLNAYLYDLSVLTVEEFSTSLNLRDSLLQAKPFMTMIISDIGNRQQTIKVYREDQKGVLGLVLDDQPVVFNPQKVRSIVRPKSFFRAK